MKKIILISIAFALEALGFGNFRINAPKPVVATTTHHVIVDTFKKSTVQFNKSFTHQKRF